jgi:excisionase family DNA binding protein
VTYSIADAARACGTSKSTVLRAIKAGRISAVRDDVTGAFQIDPAELHRVFPPASEDDDAPQDAVIDAPRAALQAELKAAEARIAEMLDAARFKDDVISDLRRRLDQEAEERRRLTALIAAATPASPPASSRRWWWSRRHK